MYLTNGDSIIDMENVAYIEKNKQDNNSISFIVKHPHGYYPTWRYNSADECESAFNTLSKWVCAKTINSLRV